MIHKVTEKQLDVSTTHIGNLIVGLGALEISGGSLEHLADQIMADPLRSAIMFGLWVIFYVTGKTPKEDKENA